MTKVTLAGGESALIVHELNSINDMRVLNPKFFKTPHGKREHFTVHRGCLIVRNTVKFTGCKPTRRTVVYLFGTLNTPMGAPYESCVMPIPEPDTIAQAKRMIDWILDVHHANEYGIRWQDPPTPTAVAPSAG